MRTVIPRMSEKSIALSKTLQYVFDVPEGLNKAELCSILITEYGQKPLDVRFINSLGKVKRFKGIKGRRSNLRKAVVKFSKVIDIKEYEG